MTFHFPAREYFGAMGAAVADRTINRKLFSFAQELELPKVLKLNPADPLFHKWYSTALLSDYPVKVDETAPFRLEPPKTRTEKWEDVAKRVAEGNAGLSPDYVGDDDGEQRILEDHLRRATVLMSGRHLQHGDKDQWKRNLELYSNCSTSATSFLLFYLLLNGSGVGRCYNDAMMVADLTKMPHVICTIDADHPDVVAGHIAGFGDTSTAVAVIGAMDPDAIPVLHYVEDSREGWQSAVEIVERMTFEKRTDEYLILDFSDVREKNKPIMGMQGRPASGPGPLMEAIRNFATLRQNGMEPWEAAMHADHFLAECVLVGGARRAARMACKHWADPSIFKFIRIKQNGGLWSSNNSVLVDEEFRAAVAWIHRRTKNLTSDRAVESYLKWGVKLGTLTERKAHAYRVFRALAHAAYHDGTGEPGIINQDKLHRNDEGYDGYLDGLFAESKRLKLAPETIPLMQALAKAAWASQFIMIVNPCGEVTLNSLGSYCVIGDFVPFHAANDDDAEEAVRAMTRALIRVNTMDALYGAEVRRTNRIGVGITGFHEWAYARFGFTWYDIIDEAKSLEMWKTLSRFKRAVVDEAERYSKFLGVAVPHTNTTFKPAGTTSKLFGLTEGAHLPPKREYLRWVQFRNDDPLVEEYRAKGYPVRELETYGGTTIVGFPTRPKICELGDGEWIVTASEATPEEQYEFLRLLEKWWIRGMDEDGVTPLPESGNQVSYTMKYDPKVVSFGRFMDTLIDGQFSIRCCSVMPEVDTSAYEYLPETPLVKGEYERIAAAIDQAEKEDLDFAHVDCSSGACPIDFKK